MNQKSPWTSLLPLLMAYGLFVFVGSLLIEPTNGYALPYTYSVFIPILLLSGAWAVLGPGSYAIRTICSIAAVLSVFLPGAVAVFLTIHSPLNPIEFFLSMAGLGIPLICVAQLPYWLGRMIFGWQLIDESQTQAKKIDIKELLTIMAVVAACLVAPTQAVAVVYGASIDPVKIGDQEVDWQIDPVTGEETWEDIVVSEENIDHFRQQQTFRTIQSQRYGLAMVIGYALFIAFLSLLNIPCFYLGMINKDPTRGFYSASVSWLVLFCLPFIGLAFSSQSLGNEFIFLLINGIFLALLFAGAAALPMLVVRANGGRLVNRSYFRKLYEATNATDSKKITDPFSD